ncbi:hypothetical protein JZ751_024174 [Albula glossodonta]|uniref:Secreted protein n=1 Tax=Albula glossodonta TaxID=121402 RepID=A0A8T2NF44_9TELE|nr:hypothetical protein JZ751_024174 [Albula glossodonta]
MVAVLTFFNFFFFSRGEIVASPAGRKVSVRVPRGPVKPQPRISDRLLAGICHDCPSGEWPCVCISMTSAMVSFTLTRPSPLLRITRVQNSSHLPNGFLDRGKSSQIAEFSPNACPFSVMPHAWFMPGRVSHHLPF